MTIHITAEISSACQAYLNTVVDWDFGGTPIFRKDTHPFSQFPSSDLLSFAAGYQAARNSKTLASSVETTAS
jgi:hypothetical protein